jgi:uncharacterized cupredoxin-like copper-binding protein
MQKHKALVAAAASLTAAGALAGVALASPAAGGGTTVKVTLGKPTELKMTASRLKVKAGEIKFVVTNAGKIGHEMVVVPLPKGQTKLKVTGSRASEKGALGEAPEMAGGKSRTIHLPLKAGRYQLVCNVPGHYQGGMYLDFTVS